jgi:hypothetical protein
VLKEMDEGGQASRKLRMRRLANQRLVIVVSTDAIGRAVRRQRLATEPCKKLLGLSPVSKQHRTMTTRTWSVLAC